MNPLTLIFDALTFRTDGLDKARRSPLVLWYGLLALVLVALVVGLVSEGAETYVQGSMTPAQRLNELVQNMDRYSTARGTPAAQFAGPAMFREVGQMILDIQALPPRAGEGWKPVATALEFLGRWFGTPFQGGWVVSLFFIGVLVHIAARLFGGRGTIVQLLGLTALSFAPAILNVLTSLVTAMDRTSQLPGLGGLASLIGLTVGAWQVAIYAKTTAVAEELTLGRSIGAMVVALVLGVGIAMIAAIVIAALVAMFVVLLYSVGQAR